MSYTLAMQQKPSQNIKQLQRLIMSRRMQQAIHLLQMPVAELSMAVQVELQQNPILEYPEDEENDQDTDTDIQMLKEDNIEDQESGDVRSEEELKFDGQDFEALRGQEDEFDDSFNDIYERTYFRGNGDREKLGNMLENTVSAETSLFNHLMRQAQETFEDKGDVVLAEALIGNFDENGYLGVSLDEIAALQGCSVGKLESLLQRIQTFDPKGVGARSLQEALLIQLRNQGKASSLAYKVIETHFDDLLHNKIPRITGALHCSTEELSEAVDHCIAKLDLHPGTAYSRNCVQTIIPDAAIRQEDDQLVASINEEALPSLRLNGHYLKMLRQEDTADDVKEFIKNKLSSAKWLLRNIFERNSTLERIAREIAKRQKAFFLNPEGQILPLTMKLIAEELQLNESTIARAIANKYIDTPRGVFALRYFFTNAIENDAGEELSSRTVRSLVKKIIGEEDKAKPLSDEAISAMITAKGIKCARRTVAKYRAAMNLGTAQQRRKY